MYKDTIRFLLNVVSGKGTSVSAESIHLNSQDGEIFQTDIYHPVNPNKPCKGTILFAHGMNKHGNKDPRMMKLCQSAALINYRAVAPTYSIVANHNIDLRLLDQFIDIVKTVTNDKRLCEQGKLGIFTASLSGSFSIRAAATPEVAPLITSLCSVGVCYNPRTTFSNILKAKNHDRYAKYISVKGLLDFASELTPALAKGLDYAIDDEFELDGMQRARQYATTLNEPDKTRLETILTEVESEEDLSQQYKPYIEIMHEAMKDLARVVNLKCHTTLIHSANDTVLPTCESKLLYQELKRHHKPAKMLITPILEHADVQFNPKYAVDMLKFVNAFHYFFKHV